MESTNSLLKNNGLETEQPSGHENFRRFPHGSNPIFIGDRNMGFTKLDEGILESSVMSEDSDTFKVWIALLASCKENGIAPVSAIFISSVCRLPIEKVVKAIEKLSSPDNYSRSLNDEGRRIKRVDGGYLIINYDKYRTYTYSSSKDAIRQRKHRDKLRHVTIDRDISASASASASEDEELRGEDLLFEQFWKLYPRKVGKPNAIRAWKKIKNKETTLKLIISAINWQKNTNQWSDVQFIPHPATYLNQTRWLDEKIENIDNNNDEIEQTPWEKLTDGQDRVEAFIRKIYHAYEFAYDKKWDYDKELFKSKFIPKYAEIYNKMHEMSKKKSPEGERKQVIREICEYMVPAILGVHCAGY